VITTSYGIADATGILPTGWNILLSENQAEQTWKLIPLGKGRQSVSIVALSRQAIG
jgi:hypothetical protein